MAIDKPATRVRYATPVQKAAFAVGVVFLLVGILGFIPGITTNYDTMTFAGHHSEAALLGIFNVSILHNIVHLAFGVAGLVMARTFTAARAYLIGGGIIYAVLWVYGLVIDQHSMANFVPVNTADNWLHLVLAVGMLLLGIALSRVNSGASTPATRTSPTA
jgi:arginine exporter protein ArgO